MFLHRPKRKYKLEFLFLTGTMHEYATKLSLVIETLIVPRAIVNKIQQSKQEKPQ